MGQPAEVFYNKPLVYRYTSGFNEPLLLKPSPQGLIIMRIQPLTHLGQMPIADFIRDYWQQKPLLIRQAFPGFISPLSPEEIAGISLEEDAESRLVIETPNPSNPLASQWQLEHGPLPEARFSELPSKNWTLLVQAVDQMFPEVHQLLNHFRFIPNWRLDDIMVSFAVEGGGVGPHFDYYDVFLLQGQGRRHWRLGEKATAESPLREDTDLKILTEFNTTEDWVLEPGDLLYIPPNIPHWGIALDDCITYSVGFRAPSFSDILLEYSQAASETLAADARFSDPNFLPQNNPGEIHPQAIAQLETILKRCLDDKNQLIEWFGRYMTERRRLAPEAEAASQGLRLNAQSRAAYWPTAQGAWLFVNGESAECSLALAQALCAYNDIQPQQFSASDQAVIAEALEAGWLTEGE